MEIIDEHPDLCGTCPIKGGFQVIPRTWKSRKVHQNDMKQYTLSSVYSCKHKVTKRPVCATPCDGQLELCDNDADENCQGPSLLLALIVTTVSSIIFISVSLAVSYARLKKDIPSVSINYELEDYQSTHDEQLEYDENNIHPTLVLSTTLDIKRRLEIACDVYKGVCQGDIVNSDRDTFIMKVLGTNYLASYFYDCVNLTLLIKIKCIMHNPMKQVFKAFQKWPLHSINLLIKSTVSLCLRYSDLAKDILLIYIVWLQLGKYAVGSFPMIIFWILVTSIATTELTNYLTIIHLQDDRANCHLNILLLPLAPLFPAFYTYEILHHELLKHKLINKYKKYQTRTNLILMSQQIKEADGKIYKFQHVLANLHLNENILETIPQLTILLMIILLKCTTSRMVDNLEGIFINGNDNIVYLIMIMSVLSLTKGQIDFLKAKKNGCSSGILVLIAYFFIGITSRLLVIKKLSYNKY